MCYQAKTSSRDLSDQCTQFYCIRYGICTHMSRITTRENTSGDIHQRVLQSLLQCPLL
jgi:hypothetical protein